MTGRRAALLSAAIVLGIGIPYLFVKHARAEVVQASTVEVREFDQLWRELKALQTDAPQLGAANFRRRVLTRTARYLELDSAHEARFGALVDAALAELQDARERIEAMNRTAADDLESETSTRRRRAAWARQLTEQRAAADRCLAVLQPSPRHRLFAERRTHWLLCLDSGARAGR